ncbi:hypothetical protein [Staphylococcus cohnii]|nr:hypothetical protein [Staphylococcus cohnii]
MSIPNMVIEILVLIMDIHHIRKIDIPLLIETLSSVDTINA